MLHSCEDLIFEDVFTTLLFIVKGNSTVFWFIDYCIIGTYCNFKIQCVIKLYWLNNNCWERGPPPNVHREYEVEITQSPCKYYIDTVLLYGIYKRALWNIFVGFIYFIFIFHVLSSKTKVTLSVRICLGLNVYRNVYSIFTLLIWSSMLFAW